MMRTVIYRLDSHSYDVRSAAESGGFLFTIWKPSWRSFLPPEKGRKYLLYWIFHVLGIFRNRDYGAVLVYRGECLISSLLVVPAHFKWPFMASGDLQFTYVLTHPDYRGQQLAFHAIQYAMFRLSKPGRSFWYVTDTGNPSSIKLCEKLGFGFYSFGYRSGGLKILKCKSESGLWA